MLLWSVLPQIPVFTKAFADSRHRERQTPAEVHVLMINPILHENHQ